METEVTRVGKSFSVPSEENMSQHFYQNERTTRLARILALMIAVSFAFAVFAAAADFFISYEVTLDGETIGYVQSPAEYEHAKHAVEAYASDVLDEEYVLPSETACTMRLVTNPASADPAPVVARMLAEVTEITEMYVLSVDGTDIAGAEEKETIESVLDFIVDHYTRGDELGEVTIANDIQILYKDAAVSLLCDYGTLYDRLMESDVLSVTATYKRSFFETVARGEKIVYDDAQYLDYEAKTEGDDGLNEVFETYTLVNGVETESAYLETVVVKVPVDDVIVRGTMEIPPTRPTGTYINPVEGGKFTSDFGKRGRYEKHTGVDIANRVNTEVVASDSGKVVFAGWRGNYGNYIIIEHGDGVETRYAHLRKLKVKVGEEVIQGQLIGLMGSTGRSTGSHLHFEVLKDGEIVDPNDYIDMSVYEDYR